MNNKKITLFLDEITPILTKLNEKWFPANLISADGYNFACTYCDCDHHGERHEDDCLYQMAKDTLEKLNEIDLSNEYNLDFKNRPRLEQDIIDIKKSAKYHIILKIMYKNLQQFIPLDYSDPANQGILCPCNTFELRPEHDDNCPIVALAQALANILTL